VTAVLGGLGVIGWLGLIVIVAVRDRARRRIYLAAGRPLAASPAPAADQRVPYAPLDPEASARGRRWARWQSWYLVLLAVPIGLTTVAGYGYLTVRSRRLGWLVDTLCFAVLTAVAFVADNPRNPGPTAQTIGAVSLAVVWLGGLVNAIVGRHRYLAQLAERRPTPAAAAWARDRADKQARHRAVAAATAALRTATARSRGLRTGRGGLAGFGVWLWLSFGTLGLGGALMAVALLPVAIVEQVHAAHFDSVAVRTVSIVVGRDNCSVECDTTVLYEAAGRVYRRELPVTSPPAVGNPLTIRYDPAHPTHVAALAGSGDDYGNFLVVMVAIGFGIAGIGFVLSRRTR
jgi:hypothetical protein